jgi:hypothetical protein
MLINALIVVVLVVIIGSLVSAFFHLVNDRGNSKRMVRALTARITLSVLLFLLLIIGYMTGLIEPHSLGR